VHYQLESFYSENNPESQETDFLGWLKMTKEEEFAGKVTRLRQSSLLEKFIREDPKVKISKEAPEILVKEDMSFSEIKSIPRLVSETLATVYRQQKKYHLAIDTYKELSLLYPEKKAFFARQIREAEKEKQHN
jgi:hypothetical protein